MVVCLSLRSQPLSLIGHLSGPETQTQDPDLMNVKEALSNLARMWLESGHRQGDSMCDVELEPPGVTGLLVSVCIQNTDDRHPEIQVCAIRLKCNENHVKVHVF